MDVAMVEPHGEGQRWSGASINQMKTRGVVESCFLAHLKKVRVFVRDVRSLVRAGQSHTFETYVKNDQLSGLRWDISKGREGAKKIQKKIHEMGVEKRPLHEWWVFSNLNRRKIKVTAADIAPVLPGLFLKEFLSAIGVAFHCSSSYAYNVRRRTNFSFSNHSS